jgi:hypothetical protein
MSGVASKRPLRVSAPTRRVKATAERYPRRKGSRRIITISDNRGVPAWFIAEPTHISGVRLTCRYGRTCTDRERPRPNRARARAKKHAIKSAFEEADAGWLVLAEQTEWIDRERVRKIGADEPS